MGSERDYDWAITQTDAYLAQMQSSVPETAVDRTESVVTDLDEDHHRMSCADGRTSMYTNQINIWLTEGSDPVAVIDAVRDALRDAGWTRSESVEEITSGAQDTEGSYWQNMNSPEGFLGSLSKWVDDGRDGISLSLTSPCVPNPSDKSDTWGR